MSKEQKSDVTETWGKKSGNLDYVTCWFKKAVDFFAGTHAGRFAFVSTNSICQGEPVSTLFQPIFDAGWRIRFAHQTFPWTTEAADGAAVHCVITGYDKNEATPAQLYTYPRFGGDPVPVEAKNINGYLLDAPFIHLISRRRMICSVLPEVSFGSMPNPSEPFVITRDEIDGVLQDPIASKFVRRFIGADELIHDLDRWCFWFEDEEYDLRELNQSSILASRLQAVREKRAASTRQATRDLIDTPHLFAERRQPTVPYLCIPSVVSENREYFTAAPLNADVIASNLVFTCLDEDGFVFAIVSSSMFITWQRAIGGYLGTSLRFSNTVVWNNLPLPPVDAELRQRIIEAGQAVLAARALHPERSLAQHYEPGNLSPELQAAHDALDVVVDQAFGALSAPFTPDTAIHQRFAAGTATNEDRLAVLFTRYQQLTH